MKIKSPTGDILDVPEDQAKELLSPAHGYQVVAKSEIHVLSGASSVSGVFGQGIADLSNKPRRGRPPKEIK